MFALHHFERERNKLLVGPREEFRDEVYT